MKNYLKLGLLVFAMSLYSCGGDDNNVSTDEVEEVVNPNEATESDAGESADATDGDLPSERIDLVSKGVGPFTDIVLPDEIDEALAAQGEELYNQHCIACHKPYEKFIGPAQAGALERRTPEWLMNMIFNPAGMLQEDPLAQELQEEFNGQIMTNTGVDEEGTRAILEYIRTL